ncbi:MAG: helix-turn-helix domain-containing protein [Fimbriimonas ginsengisoli]|uniref:Helix-turn-helix domain-containing protein n=1 Tax=Fimbriimonas ginsengisoli TaxID=1005039 RepID=A0A931LQH4_FIMGI|nr:helix-turn-helix domain-containing protein [Fimbriimonas ginsengisoli]
MNFADALRKANQMAHGQDPEDAEFHYNFDPEVGPPNPIDEPTQSAMAAARPERSLPDTPIDPFDIPDQQSQPGTPVRFEMFLTPEQLSNLFRAVIANQHTVFTLREAANHLRLHAHVLEEMARAGDIPAFLVDGKWRFSRNGLDEWMNTQASRKEAS